MWNKVKDYLSRNETLRYFLQPDMAYAHVVNMVYKGELAYKDVVFERLYWVPKNADTLDYHRLYDTAIEADVSNYHLLPLEAQMDERMIMLAIDKHPLFYRELPNIVREKLFTICYAWKKYESHYPDLVPILKKDPMETMRVFLRFASFAEDFNRLLKTEEERYAWVDLFLQEFRDIGDANKLPDYFLDNMDWCLNKIEAGRVPFKRVSERLKNDPYFVYKVLMLPSTTYEKLTQVLGAIGEDLGKRLNRQNFFEELKNLAAKELLSEKYKDINAKALYIENVL
jgi:hypothetical protein